MSLITNERQYRITKAQANRFRAAIDAKTMGPPDRAHMTLHQVSIDAMASQIATLTKQLEAYDELRASGGKRRRIELADLASAKKNKPPRKES